MKTYEGRVRVKLSAPADMRPGEQGWIIDTIRQGDRPTGHLANIASGTVYFVEFADGKTDAIHESVIEPTD